MSAQDVGLVHLCRSVACSLAVCSVLALAWAHPLHAQESQETPELRVMLLRETALEAADVAEAVDGALLRDLADLAGIDSPVVSPIDYAEIKLTVGCGEATRVCLAAIASMSNVDAVLLRTLQPRKHGGRRMLLMYYDAASHDAPVQANVEVGPNESDALVAAVPAQVRALFGIPEPAEASERSGPVATQDEPQTPASELQLAVTEEPAMEPAAPEYAAALRLDDTTGPLERIRPWTWATLAAGGAVLAGGVVMHFLADRAEGRYEDSIPAFEAAILAPETESTTADIERARANTEEKFGTARNLHTARNIILPVGGVLLGAGVGLLVWDLTRGGGRGERNATVSFTPLLGGGALMLGGTL